MAPFIPIIAAVSVAVTGIIASKKVDMNKVLMRFFRDVARSKARKRLYGNKHALIPMLWGNEVPLPIKTRDDFNAEELLTLTSEELSEYTGEDGGPLYLGIKGRVYDVSAKENLYGEDGRYNLFVGKDATHAFATGCLQDTEECVNSSMEGLDEKELREIDRWVELYETHDKYTFVGFLVEDPVNKILEADEAEEIQYV
jgi:predicted heme/steroid binding protein